MEARLGSCVAVSAAPIGPLAWELPYVWVQLKEGRKEGTRREGGRKELNKALPYRKYTLRPNSNISYPL